MVIKMKLDTLTVDLIKELEYIIGKNVYKKLLKIMKPTKMAT